MKTSSVSAKPEALSPQTARGCVGTNLALPGFGSLMAGRPAGYPQAALTVVGFTLTVWFGVRFAVWYFHHASFFNDTEADPVETLIAIWVAVRWALLGFALVAISWLWALATNAAILRSARPPMTKEMPPVLN